MARIDDVMVSGTFGNIVKNKQYEDNRAEKIDPV
jgi:hypothetical protein